MCTKGSSALFDSPKPDDVTKNLQYFSDYFWDLETSSSPKINQLTAMYLYSKIQRGVAGSFF